MNRTKPTLLALAAKGALTLGGLSLAGVGAASATGTTATVSSNAAVTPTDPTDPAGTATVDASTDPAAAPTPPADADGRPGASGPGQVRPGEGHGGGCDDGGADHGGDRRGGEMLDAVAAAIGIDVTDLRTSLAGGQTIADVATANSVEPSVVVDAIVAVRAERLADAVANGRLTQEEADARLADQTAKIEAHINGTDDAPTPAAPADSAPVDSAPVTEATTA